MLSPLADHWMIWLPVILIPGAITMFCWQALRKDAAPFEGEGQPTVSVRDDRCEHLDRLDRIATHGQVPTSMQVAKKAR